MLHAPEAVSQTHRLYKLVGSSFGRARNHLRKYQQGGPMSRLYKARTWHKAGLERLVMLVPKACEALCSHVNHFNLMVNMTVSMLALGVTALSQLELSQLLH